MNIAVFAVDPGGHTGMGWGIFDPTLKDVGEQLRGRLSAGGATITGDQRTQIRGIVDLWQGFYHESVAKFIPPDQVWYVCEDYILKPGETAGGGESTISAELIWGVEGYRMGQAAQARKYRRGLVVMPDMVLQMAGQAKSYATGRRLKEWDCWTVGKEHERSAWAHIAFFLKRYQIQFPRARA